MANLITFCVTFLVVICFALGSSEETAVQSGGNTTLIANTKKNEQVPEENEIKLRCPGAHSMGVAGDFGKPHTNIVNSCFFDLRIEDVKGKKVEKDGFILIVFKSVNLFPGDTIVIKSNGKEYFGPYSHHNPPPHSMIVGPNATVEVKVGNAPISSRSKNVRSIWGYFTGKDIFLHSIKTDQQSDSVKAPLYKRMNKYFYIQYQFNLKTKNKKSKTNKQNYTVWFDCENIASDQLTLKQQWHKDVNCDPHGNYFVGSIFSVIYDLNASNEKSDNLMINYKPINLECSDDIHYLNASKVFKPSLTATESSGSSEPFECLIVVHEALSPLLVKISNLQLNEKLKLDARDGPNIHSRPLVSKQGHENIELKSTHDKIWISITGITPIPPFEIDLDCLKCNRHDNLQIVPMNERLPVSVNETPMDTSGSSMVWILTGVLGAPATVFVVFLGYKKYRNGHQRIGQMEDDVLFSTSSLIKFE